MHIELNCSCHPTGFRARASTSGDRVRSLLADVAASYELADADTFEGMVLATLVRWGGIRCHDCGEGVSVQAISRPARASIPA